MREHRYRRLPRPEKENGLPEWATFVASRYPHFKVHNSIGPAKSSITTYGHGVMYQLQPVHGEDITYVPVAVVNSTEQKSHPYRKMKPDVQHTRVVIYKIAERPQLDEAA